MRNISEQDRKKSGPRPRPILERFFLKVQKTETCWVWTGAKTFEGYGVLGVGSKKDGMIFAHRLSFQSFNSPLVDGLVIDHICRNPSCVNPKHLRQITHQENITIGNGPTAINAAKTHCKRGHELIGENLYLRPDGRRCKRCRIILYKAQYLRKKNADNK